ncbi:LysR family transcriptional regulator [Enterococcus crotali]|uniref:LysR family transcriptional regulator n=1 Tax=Enterococcus crotali TaxID=1453587 RepID=UPI00047176BF|nr:LysR family transcriptional regulator [Enterococcus crotali]
MKLKHLDYFLALCKNKSFTKTSEELGISQPYLSTHIRELEQELNAQLITRDYGNNTLTPEGAVLKRRGETIFKELETALEEINLLVHTGDTATIKIGTNLADTDYLIAKLLTNFHKLYPSVSLDYGYYPNLEDVLENKEIDIAIGILSENNATITSDLIFSESYVVYTSTKNPLADLNELKANQLLDVPLIKYSKQIYEENIIRSWIESNHPELKENHSYELPSTISILNLVDQDFGIAFLPYSLVDSLPLYLNVSAIEIIDGPFRNISIGYDANCTISNAHKALIDQLPFIF